jgi:hypothetical protein
MMDPSSSGDPSTAEGDEKLDTMDDVESNVTGEAASTDLQRSIKHRDIASVFAAPNSDSSLATW